MSGWVYSWKNAHSMFFRGTLSLVAVPKWFHNDFLCLYSSKRWQLVSWYNLDKELKGIKDFLKKKKSFLYWIWHRYQSKTYVEHIEQVIDKSLINSTNSSMNLLYFSIWGYVLNIVKSAWEVKSRKFKFFGRVYGHVRFNFSVSIIGFTYMQGYCNALDILYVFFVKFVVETFFFNKAHFSKVLWLLQWVSFSGKDY